MWSQEEALKLGSVEERENGFLSWGWCAEESAHPSPQFSPWRPCCCLSYSGLLESTSEYTNAGLQQEILLSPSASTASVLSVSCMKGPGDKHFKERECSSGGRMSVCSGQNRDRSDGLHRESRGCYGRIQACFMYQFSFFTCSFSLMAQAWEEIVMLHMSKAWYVGSEWSLPVAAQRGGLAPAALGRVPAGSSSAGPAVIPCSRCCAACLPVALPQQCSSRTAFYGLFTCVSKLVGMWKPSAVCSFRGISDLTCAHALAFSHSTDSSRTGRQC